MNDRPGVKDVPCPRCDNIALAVVPKGSELVEAEEDADGKVWVDCRDCGARFLAHYRTD